MSNPGPDAETIGGLLRRAREQLRAAGIEDPEIEAELLLRQALRGDSAELPSKGWLLQRLGDGASASSRDALAALLARRLHHEPSAYITGMREFWGLEFEVTPDVLIPRPETELLVEKAIECAHSPRTPLSSQGEGTGVRTAPSALRLVDVGTGSGAVAVALAKALPAATVIATDASRGALAVARRNATRHGVEPRISFRHGDLLLPLDCYVDFIVANLPYVPEADWRGLEPEVKDHEPSLALVGGEDGLDLIRALLHQAPRYLRPGGAICLEFGAGQENGVIDLARQLVPGAKIEVAPDFAGIPRVLIVRV